jgi:hypothetical protein
VLQASALEDEVLADLWDEVSSISRTSQISNLFICVDSDVLQALSATYEDSPAVEPKEGFLNKNEFFIILAGLQKHLGVDEIIQREDLKA